MYKRQKRAVHPDQIELLHQIVDSKVNKSIQPIKPSTLERMDLEDRLNDWFDTFQYENRIVAETFSEHDFKVEELEVLKNKLGTEALVAALPWLENSISTQKIIRDLGIASQHITTLVTAIKSHVHMDRSSDLQPTNGLLYTSMTPFYNHFIRGII